MDLLHLLVQFSLTCLHIKYLLPIQATRDERFMQKESQKRKILLISVVWGIQKEKQREMQIII